jgi:hypothetical protein
MPAECAPARITPADIAQRLEALRVMLADSATDLQGVVVAVGVLATSLEQGAPQWTAQERDEAQEHLASVMEVALSRRSACLQALQEQGAGRRAVAGYGAGRAPHDGAHL